LKYFENAAMKMGFSDGRRDKRGGDNDVVESSTTTIATQRKNLKSEFLDITGSPAWP